MQSQIYTAHSGEALISQLKFTVGFGELAPPFLAVLISFRQSAEDGSQ